jgi:hypothetical protein
MGGDALTWEVQRRFTDFRDLAAQLELYQREHGLESVVRDTRDTRAFIMRSVRVSAAACCCLPARPPFAAVCLPACLPACCCCCLLPA